MVHSRFLILTNGLGIYSVWENNREADFFSIPTINDSFITYIVTHYFLFLDSDLHEITRNLVWKNYLHFSLLVIFIIGLWQAIKKIRYRLLRISALIYLLDCIFKLIFLVPYKMLLDTNANEQVNVYVIKTSIYLLFWSTIFIITLSIISKVKNLKGAHSNYKIANKQNRFAHLLIDSLLIVLFTFSTLQVISIMDRNIDYTKISMIFVFTSFIYYAFSELLFGHTPSRLITGCYLITFDQNEPDRFKLFIRVLSRKIPFNPLSGLMGEFWHDKLSKTLVVKPKYNEERLSIITFTVALLILYSLPILIPESSLINSKPFFPREKMQTKSRMLQKKAIKREEAVLKLGVDIPIKCKRESGSVSRSSSDGGSTQKHVFKLLVEEIEILSIINVKNSIDWQHSFPFKATNTLTLNTDCPNRGPFEAKLNIKIDGNNSQLTIKGCDCRPLIFY